MTVKISHMKKPGNDMKSAGVTALSQADFMRRAGIGPDLAEFIHDFIECPDIFFSMSLERRGEIENQLDNALSSIVRL